MGGFNSKEHSHMYWHKCAVCNCPRQNVENFLLQLKVGYIPLPLLLWWSIGWYVFSAFHILRLSVRIPVQAVINMIFSTLLILQIHIVTLLHVIDLVLCKCACSWRKCCCAPVCVANGEFDSSEERPPREVYIPPAPPEDKGSIFATLDAGINFDKYDEIPVEVTGRASTEVQPIHSFDGANLYETLHENVRKSSYMKPTPIQKYAIPIILAGRDVIACAQTGSGKTVRSSVLLG